MAKQVAKSDVFAKIGTKANKSFNAAKKKEVVVPGGGSVPGGIENGIAKLTSITFDEFKKGDNKGKPYFMAQGVVVNPDGSNKPWIVNGVRADGLQTKFGPEPLCDTPLKKGQTARKNARLTFDDHMGHVVNLFKLLAGKEAVEGLEDASELKELGESLIEQGTYFSFRTWQPPKRKKGEPGYTPKYDGPDSPPSRVIETWGAAVEGFEIGASEGEEVEDEEEEEDEDAESEAEESGDEEESEEEEEEEEEESEEEEEEEEAEDDGLDEVAEAADNEKVSAAQKKARKELTAKAIEAGYTAEEVEEAEDFASVVEMIRNPKEESEEEEEEESEEEEEEEEAAPEVGTEYKYKPKGAKKAIDVEVTKVNEKLSVAYAKDSATKKAILDPKTKKPLGIPFGELIAE